MPKPPGRAKESQFDFIIALPLHPSNPALIGGATEYTCDRSLVGIHCGYEIWNDADGKKTDSAKGYVALRNSRWRSRSDSSAD